MFLKKHLPRNLAKRLLAEDLIFLAVWHFHFLVVKLIKAVIGFAKNCFKSILL